MMRLSEAARAIRAELRGEDRTFDAVSTDTRSLPAHALFVALRGKNFDGHDFVARAAEAERVLAAAFVNLSAVCAEVVADPRPLHIVCAGTQGTPALEDTLLAGALVDCVSEAMEVDLDDSARLAWDCFENNGQVLREALALGRGGRHLKSLGLEQDIVAASEVDKVNVVAELRRDPLRFEISGIGRGCRSSVPR